jgi:nitrogen fixation protein FixH
MKIVQTFANLRTNLQKKYSQSNPQAMRNPWVIAWIGIVAVFLLVNITFFIVAWVSSPGLVVEDYYEQGRQYEKNALQIMAAQNRLNWETRLEIPETIVQDSADVYRFSAVDTRGLPIGGAEVKLLAYRPSDASADFATVLQEIAPGLYQAGVGFPLQGVWDIQIKAQYGEDVYHMSHRVSVLKTTTTP